MFPGMQSALSGLRNQEQRIVNLEQVKTLRDEAEQAGDQQTVRDCDDILAGNEDYAAFQRVKVVIENAEAQQD